MRDRQGPGSTSWPTVRWQRLDDTGDLAVLIAAVVGMGLNGELILRAPVPASSLTGGLARHRQHGAYPTPTEHL
jgi:hypothetical protein